MDRRTTAAYKAVFRFINKNVLSLKGVASFTSDFERAMRNALKTLYPSTKRFTCHFHYCQALKRRAYQTDALVNVIRSDPKCRYERKYDPSFMMCSFIFCSLGPFIIGFNVYHCYHRISSYKRFEN